MMFGALIGIAILVHLWPRSSSRRYGRMGVWARYVVGLALHALRTTSVPSIASTRLDHRQEIPRRHAGVDDVG